MPPPGYSTGLIPRDYKSFPPGFYAPVAPDAWLVPASEQEDRLKEQQANQASLWDLREANYDTLKSLDQDGLGLCHTADTEVLTEKGWTPWPEYNYSDLLGTVSAAGVMEFQAPFEKHVYPYDGETVHSTNRRLDFGVTPDHRMLVRKWDEAKRTLSDRYTFQRAGEIGWYAGLMAAPRGWVGTELKRVAVPGDREYDGDDFVAMLALVVSDGYAGGTEGSRPGKGTKNLVSFAAFRPDRREATAALAARIGFKEAPSRPGVWNRWDAGALAEWVRANCYTGGGLGARRKRVPDIVKALCPRQIALFIDFFGDRSYRPDSIQFYSTSKRMIDDLQELLLRVGKRSTISKHGPRLGECNGKPVRSGEGYTLTAAQEDRLCIERKKHIEKDRYKGLVYCAAVPNGTLITRRNGSVLISGNCWAFSTTKAVMYTRAVMGAPPERLSGWYTAGMVKRWRDEGGWGAESLQWVRSGGLTTEALCPRYSAQYDTPAVAADAATRKVIEWYDGTDDRDQNTQIMISAFLLGLAPVLDYNWLSHSMCGCKLVSINPLEVWTDNSWGDTSQYGPKGCYRLTGSKAIPDGVVVPRVSQPGP